MSDDNLKPTKGVKAFSIKNAALEIMLVLEKQKIPICAVDEILAAVKSGVMEQPVTTSRNVGLPIHDYEENENRLIDEVRQRKQIIKNAFEENKDIN